MITTTQNSQEPQSARVLRKGKPSSSRGVEGAGDAEEEILEAEQQLPERIKREIYEQKMEEDMKNMVPRRLHQTQIDEIGEKIVSLQNKMVDLYTDPKFKHLVYSQLGGARNYDELLQREKKKQLAPQKKPSPKKSMKNLISVPVSPHKEKNSHEMRSNNLFEVLGQSKFPQESTGTGGESDHQISKDNNEGGSIIQCKATKEPIIQTNNKKIVETSLAFNTNTYVRPTSSYVVQKQSTVYALKYHRLQKQKGKQALLKAQLDKYRSQSLVEQSEFSNRLEELEESHLHLNDYFHNSSILSVNDYFPQELILEDKKVKETVQQEHERSQRLNNFQERLESLKKGHGHHRHSSQTSVAHTSSQLLSLMPVSQEDEEINVFQNLQPGASQRDIASGSGAIVAAHQTIQTQGSIIKKGESRRINVREYLADLRSKIEAQFMSDNADKLRAAQGGTVEFELDADDDKVEVGEGEDAEYERQYRRNKRDFGKLLNQVIQTQHAYDRIAQGQKSDVDDLTQLFSGTKGNLSTYFSSMEDVRKNLQLLNTKIIKCQRLLSANAPFLVSSGKVQPELWDQYVAQQLTGKKVLNREVNRPKTSMDSKKNESTRKQLASIDEAEVMELGPNEERPKTAIEFVELQRSKLASANLSQREFLASQGNISRQNVNSGMDSTTRASSSHYTKTLLNQHSSKQSINGGAPTQGGSSFASNLNIFFGSQKQDQLTFTNQMSSQQRQQLLHRIRYNTSKSNLNNEVSRKSLRDDEQSLQLVRYLERINEEIQQESVNMEKTCRQQVKRTYMKPEMYETKMGSIATENGQPLDKLQKLLLRAQMSGSQLSPTQRKKLGLSRDQAVPSRFSSQLPAYTRDEKVELKSKLNRRSSMASVNTQVQYGSVVSSQPSMKNIQIKQQRLQSAVVSKIKPVLLRPHSSSRGSLISASSNNRLKQQQLMINRNSSSAIMMNMQGNDNISDIERHRHQQASLSVRFKAD